MGSGGPQILVEIVKAQAQATGEVESAIASRILQNTGFILHRENARAIVRRSSGPAVAAHSMLASAADIASANVDTTIA